MRQRWESVDKFSAALRQKLTNKRIVLFIAGILILLIAALAFCLFYTPKKITFGGEKYEISDLPSATKEKVEITGEKIIFSGERHFLHPIYYYEFVSEGEYSSYPPTTVFLKKTGGKFQRYSRIDEL